MDMAHCEICQQPLVTAGNKLHCPACGQPLEILKACGAVDYFCPHGDGLIAKKRVTLTLVTC
ncbi:zinc-ribbon domain-containing protein [Candidatus Sodalis sp. SoCistrobi]|uniref:YfgJ family double zinc ribbon protein n=1 Tax=Candidatus Sodalis sp. SoCistrobi TaxID=1922216 RepID=UPI000939C384|nr:zinc-ribbon domain-containing protein [Candidatus Sodalis sp. SoCistrobi]